MSGAKNRFDSNVFCLNENDLVIFEAFERLSWKIMIIWGKENFGNAFW